MFILSQKLLNSGLIVNVMMDFLYLQPSTEIVEYWNGLLKNWLKNISNSTFLTSLWLTQLSKAVWSLNAVASKRDHLFSFASWKMVRMKGNGDNVLDLFWKLGISNGYSCIQCSFLSSNSKLRSCFMMHINSSSNKRRSKDSNQIFILPLVFSSSINMILDQKKNDTLLKTLLGKFAYCRWYNSKWGQNGSLQILFLKMLFSFLHLIIFNIRSRSEL